MLMIINLILDLFNFNVISIDKGCILIINIVNDYQKNPGNPEKNPLLFLVLLGCLPYILSNGLPLYAFCLGYCRR